MGAETSPRTAAKASWILNSAADSTTNAMGLPPRVNARRTTVLVWQIQGITARLDRANVVGKVCRVERLAQARDMDIDGARNDMKISTPHRFEQFPSGKHASGLSQEVLEKTKLERPKRDPPAIAID